MLTIPPPPFRKHRPRSKRRTTPVAQPLTLVSASFDPGFPEAFLTFDREIDIQNIHGLAFTIDDGQFTGNLYTMMVFGASHDGPNTLRMTLQVVGTATGGQVLLSVLENNGIVAVDDGGTWAGVTDLALPFP